MVTKQEQLEWLAKWWHKWPKYLPFVMMSKIREGCAISDSASSEFGYYKVTRKEWQQERDKMSSKPEVDNSWHERGELPPVGCECLSPGGEAIMITSHGSISDVPVAFYPSGVGGLYSAACAKQFRPLRAEREKSIDEMVYEFIDHYGDPKGGERYLKIATKLYDAGYRKQ